MDLFGALSHRGVVALSLPKDLAPALVILSKNAGDADDAEASAVTLTQGHHRRCVRKSRGMRFATVA